MKCSACERTDRALFTRLLSKGRYTILCGPCLKGKNQDILRELEAFRPAGYPTTKALPVRQCDGFEN